ncbi:hypothetical protein FOL47_000860 [Perkinsus chesapeaki]|uniref:Uncharacterized protein n=1 Tax=Perkinsus chesapeaki TaxID=330153 RepID=A0A7J6MKQ4_PERCH|nr:hypothetical protein FOL47_000860 [Perkinsus chesapeaki]
MAFSPLDWISALTGWTVQAPSQHRRSIRAKTADTVANGPLDLRSKLLEGILRGNSWPCGPRKKFVIEGWLAVSAMHSTRYPSASSEIVTGGLCPEFPKRFSTFSLKEWGMIRLLVRLSTSTLWEWYQCPSSGR